MKNIFLSSVLTFFTLFHLANGLQCYVGRIGAPSYVQQCPITSQGCIKLILYQSNGYEQVEKLCADEERPGFSYREGCDTISVPFKQRECYCKQNLCNSTNKNAKVKNEVFVATISLTILSSFLSFK